MSVQRQIDRLITYQAAEWFEILRCGAHSRYPQFVQWISESPRHMEAFLAIASQAAVLQTALRRGQFDLPALLRQVVPQIAELPPAHQDQQASAYSDPAHHRQTLLARMKPGRPLRVAFSAIAVIAISAIAIHLTLGRWQRFETVVGEQRTVQLAEGSVVDLDAQSRIDVRFERAQREVNLMRGEALFKVHHDAIRPFRVHTPNAIVQAIGTQFNVYARPDGATDVAVLEGKVRIFPLGAGVDSHESLLVLQTGERLKISAGGKPEQPGDGDISDAIAWRQRKLIFKHAPLEDIAAQFNRYNKSLQIRLEGIESDSFRYTGAFDADDPQSLAALLAHEPDLAVERSAGEILIRHR